MQLGERFQDFAPVGATTPHRGSRSESSCSVASLAEHFFSFVNSYSIFDVHASVKHAFLRRRYFRLWTCFAQILHVELWPFEEPSNRVHFWRNDSRLHSQSRGGMTENQSYSVTAVQPYREPLRTSHNIAADATAPKRSTYCRHRLRGYSCGRVFLYSLASAAAIALLVTLCSLAQMRSRGLHTRLRQLSVNDGIHHESGVCGSEPGGETSEEISEQSTDGITVSLSSATSTTQRRTREELQVGTHPPGAVADSAPSIVISSAPAANPAVFPIPVLFGPLPSTQPQPVVVQQPTILLVPGTAETRSFLVLPSPIQTLLVFAQPTPTATSVPANTVETSLPHPPAGPGSAEREAAEALLQLSAGREAGERPEEEPQPSTSSHALQSVVVTLSQNPFSASAGAGVIGVQSGGLGYPVSAEESFLCQHTFCRLPLVKVGRSVRQLQPYAALCVAYATVQPLRLLKQARSLLAKPIITAKELESLTFISEQLCAYIVYDKFDLSTFRIARIAEFLCLRFLLMDVIVSVLQLLGQQPEGHWWEQVIDKVPHTYPGQDKPLRQLRVKHFFWKMLLQDVSPALQVLKAGRRPSNRDLVKLKRMIFCSKMAPRKFRYGAFDVWRRDDERFC